MYIPKTNDKAYRAAGCTRISYSFIAAYFGCWTVELRLGAAGSSPLRSLSRIATVEQKQAMEMLVELCLVAAASSLLHSSSHILIVEQRQVPGILVVLYRRVAYA